LQVKVLAAYRLSMAESAEGDLEASLRWLDQGEVWARELGWSRSLAWYLWRRGANLVEAGRYAEAEPYLLQAMETVTWDEPRFFAYAKYRLARVYQEDRPSGPGPPHSGGGPRPGGAHWPGCPAGGCGGAAVGTGGGV